MKNAAVKVLDDKDLEFVEEMSSLNVSRNVSLMIAYLASVDEASSREIEMVTGLRQPEVSAAMSTLRDNNWIHERDKKEGGKGRPMRIYALSTPIDKIIKHFEWEKVQEFDHAMKSIRKLKELATS